MTLNPLFHSEAQQLEDKIEASLLALQATTDEETSTRLAKEIRHYAVQYKLKTGDWYRRSIPASYGRALAGVVKAK